MVKRLIFLVAAIGIWLSPAALGTTIIWVSFHPADDSPSSGAAGTGLTTASDKGYTDLLAANGFPVTRYVQTATPDAAVLNAADLVIISRSGASTSYQDAAATRWNQITAPMIILNGYASRQNRMGFYTGNTIPDITGDITLTVNNPQHPIFTGIALTSGTMTNPYAGIVNHPTTGAAMRGISIVTEPANANGTVLATVPAGSSTGPAGAMVIAEWPAGVTVTHAGGDGTDTLGGKRLVFLTGGRETSGVNAETAGCFDLRPDGAKMFVNAVRYMLGKSVSPNIAGSPSPADKQTDVLRGTNLGWTAGENAVTHDVYLGTSFDDVNTASTSNPKGVLRSQGLSTTTFDPGALQYGVTYYWRVDETEQNGTLHKGEVWSFTIEAVANEVTGITATASSSDTGKSPAFTVDKSGLTGDLHGTDIPTMWVSAKGAAQPTWIQYDLGKVCKLQDMWVWNYNIDFEYILGMGIKTATVEYSTDAATWTSLGSVAFAQGESAPNYAHNTTVSFQGVAARYVKITAESNWSGTAQYGLSEVRFYCLPVAAREPNPTTGATGVAVDTALSWRAGREASSHSIYVSTDANALTLAGTSTVNSFSPAGLSLGTKYYWRVDEVNTAEAISTWAGDVWNFTTSPFIPVDDMESYNDTTNKVFDVWIDGYSTPTTNAAIVGLDSAVGGTFNSTTIYHAGRQAMPLAYNNTASVPNAEATRTFDPAQDWTRNGVKTLTLYFYGQATNATNVPLWVKLTDQSGKSAKVTFGAAAGEDTAAVADPAWTTWNMPLSSFTGVTLSRIKSMTIGLGNGAGAGMLYIDDVRLYPTVTTTTITPTLVGWWKLDNDVKDSSGNGNNGTITGAPTYTAGGKVGAALKLNGTADYVDCGTAASLDITDQVTLSAWIKPGNFANSAYQTFVGKGDKSYCIQQTNGNVIQFFVYDAAWYTANSATVTSAMNNAWHHVAGTYDGAQLKLYVDGAMAASSLRAGVIATTTYTLSIGRNSEQSGRLFNGEIDEVQVYRGALPTTEVKKLANP